MSCVERRKQAATAGCAARVRAANGIFGNLRLAEPQARGGGRSGHTGRELGTSRSTIAAGSWPAEDGTPAPGAGACQAGADANSKAPSPLHSRHLMTSRRLGSAADAGAGSLARPDGVPWQQPGLSIGAAGWARSQQQWLRHMAAVRQPQRWPLQGNHSADCCPGGGLTTTQRTPVEDASTASASTMPSRRRAKPAARRLHPNARVRASRSDAAQTASAMG